MTRAILLAARGWDQKWQAEKPKHLALIGSETVLQRTVRQLSARGIWDVHVAGDYSATGASCYIPSVEQAEDADIDVMSSRERWATDDRTLILYADTVWTESAMDSLLFDYPDFRVYCRPWPSATYGHPWGELFAIGLQPEHHEFADYNLARMVHLKRADVLHRVGGWELARLMAKVSLDDLHRHQMLDSFVVIDDQTDDIDTPEDAERLARWFA